MLLFATQTPEEQAASEKALYVKKFTYGLAIAGTLGTLLWAVQKNKKSKVLYAIGGLVGGIVLGTMLDNVANKESTVTVATSTVAGASTASN